VYLAKERKAGDVFKADCEIILLVIEIQFSIMALYILQEHYCSPQNEGPVLA
jgi:hypothetical protein